MDVSAQRYGDAGLLVSAPEFEDLAFRQRLGRALLEHPPAGYLEHVLGAGNLLLLFHGAISERLALDWFAGLEPFSESVGEVPRLHEVPVVYEGPDLAEVAEATGLTIDEVIHLHSDPEYQVRMMGFSPGFPYLDGLNPRLHLPRRGSPRKRIEPGTVAIGGPHAGIYSIASPGGWHLLGRTELRLFKPEHAVGSTVDAAQVFCFRPGDRLRFVPVSRGTSG